MRYRTLALAAAMTLPFTAACGDDVNNPFRNFQIDDELAQNLYVYDFTDATIEVRYYPETNQVVGVSRAKDRPLEVGFFGPPLDSRTFTIVAAALDSNGNGDFLDEEDIPLTRESSGSFSENGEGFRLDLEVDLGLGFGAVTFTEVGELQDIRDLP